jgi:bla regulator protein BlaR1
MKLKVILMVAALAAPAVFLAASEVTINTTKVNSRLVDDINLPFVSDPAVLGEWDSVDFVRVPEDFVPGAKRFRGTLSLRKLVFLPTGSVQGQPWLSWTKGVVMHGGDRTASRYLIKEINGAQYMFFEWKSGDYSIKGRTPEYCVLKKD